MPTTPVLILPGLGDSGPGHWQTIWETKDARLQRVRQDEWDAPDVGAWSARLDQAVRSCDAYVVLVGHSSSCALVAHWACVARSKDITRVRGALLVAPSDPEGPQYPAGPRGFAPVPLIRLPFPSVVVASDDDPYVTEQRAREYATAWGSEFVLLNGAGHINVASGHGEWPEGFALLDRLRGLAVS